MTPVQAPAAQEPTPGPWRIGHGLTNDGQRYLMAGHSDDPVRVALIDRRSPYKRGRGYDGDCAERDANARLIAAAPDLLEAAELALEAFDSAPSHFSRDNVKAIAALREALSRATGSEQ